MNGIPKASKGPTSEEGILDGARTVVRSNLQRLADFMAEDGMPRPALDGKLLRPLSAFLTIPEERRGELDDRFWWGALAVEMVHEASLLHDDILDEAPERRGKPTLSATAGIGPALVLGDHLLTSAYRAANKAGSARFLDLFITAVERTVAGEIAQERAQGQFLSEERYRENITAKSGELFRAVFSLAPTLLDVGSARAVGAIGARLGCLYQMVDDFLDYCPDADRGKPPLQDFRQEKWTWPLGLVGAADFQTSESEILRRLFARPGNGFGSPMEVGVRRLEEEAQTLLEELRTQGLDPQALSVLLSGWGRLLQEATEEEVSRVSAGVEFEAAVRNGRLPLGGLAVTSGLRNRVSAGGTPSPWPVVLDRPNSPRSPGNRTPNRSSESSARQSLAAASGFLGTPEARLTYFTRHAKTFRFASRLFPADALEEVAGIYAFCRFTDDLVDEAEGVNPDALEALLDAWLGLAREAYGGRATGISLLDQVLGEARKAQVPFHYVEELIEGVRMDIRPRSYRTLEDLRVYSYRVASVVGGWMVEQFGIHDPSVLERAFALGHAMQLTNILRDVGEDLRRGRLYLPREYLDQYGIDRDLLTAKAKEGSLMFPGYRKLLDALMARAEMDYEAAFEAIPALPGFFQGPVAVAARAYRGIHSEIRQNGYDNLNRRARTSLLKKGSLGLRALLDLARLKRKRPGTGLPDQEAPAFVKETQEATA